MKIDNPFDKTMEINRRSMDSITRDALINVTDTLDFCWAAAKAVFEETATPEHALQICEMVMANIARNQDTARDRVRTGGESGARADTPQARPRAKQPPD